MFRIEKTSDGLFNIFDEEENPLLLNSVEYGKNKATVLNRCKKIQSDVQNWMDDEEWSNVADSESYAILKNDGSIELSLEDRYSENIGNYVLSIQTQKYPKHNHQCKVYKTDLALSDLLRMNVDSPSAHEERKQMVESINQYEDAYRYMVSTESRSW